MRFSRTTIYEACEFLSRVTQYHGEYDDLMLRWELDALEADKSGSIRQRYRRLFKFVRDNPETAWQGRGIQDLVVEAAAVRIPHTVTFLGEGSVASLGNALKQDGYLVDAEGLLRAMLPEALGLPATHDEVHDLLERHNLVAAKGHLDQALAAHTRGDWAAANGQLRTFYEALFDGIALHMDPEGAENVGSGEGSRRLLSKTVPPFLRRDLNEWTDDGKNFVNGTLKRLHPQGSHPGLSDEEDCTFRLHLVLVVARCFLRRLDGLEPV